MEIFGIPDQTTRLMSPISQFYTPVLEVSKGQNTYFSDKHFRKYLGDRQIKKKKRKDLNLMGLH